MKLRKSCIFKKTIFGTPENLSKTAIFFDIETTGLSWRTSHLYMIGCAFYDPDKDGWILQQWFLEKPSEEKELLELFAEFLNDHPWDSLVHYNGTTFDLPYLRSKYQFYKLEDPLVSIETDSDRQSLDLFTQIRRYKKYLNTPSLKQRDLEICFGLPRDDCYTGGELISVYHEYLRSGDENLLNCLWLHNYEDVQNLLPICSGVRAYQDLFTGKFRILSSGFISDSATDSSENNVFVAALALSFPLPQTLDIKTEHCTLHAEKSSAELTIPVYEGELRHYFADYKNYYYLPDEDMAIHKSVGSFVDPAHRKKATADTCYQRVCGQFLPQMDDVFSPSLRHAKKDNVSWFRIEEVRNPENSAIQHKYVQSFLSHLR